MKTIRDAKWIGSPISGCNTWNLSEYSILYSFSLSETYNNTASKNTDSEEPDSSLTTLIFSARNKDNYLAIEISADSITFAEYTDNAWKGCVKEGRGRAVNEIKKWVLNRAITESVELNLKVKDDKLTLKVNSDILCDNESLMPPTLVNEPRKSRLMMVGLNNSEKITVSSFAVYNECEILLWDLSNDNSEYFLKPGEINLIDPVSPVMVGKKICPKKRIHKATITSSARGFYEMYIDGKKIGEEYYAPGFTDYRIHLDYQEYDITKMVNDRYFMLTGVVSKGYYSGFCGYSGAENYGRENSFIACVNLEYEDGTADSIITDESFKYTSCCPVISADYLDGEYYDARLNSQFLMPDYENLESAAIKDDIPLPKPTNGEFTNENIPDFVFMKQDYPAAKVRQVLHPMSVCENPKGHFVYDFGQNMVGTVRITFSSVRGREFKLRYGEMSYKNGEIYIQNLRTAANTDVYICSGENDVFTPSFTSHGFRYLEVSGHGYELNDSSEITSVEGLVINNIESETGDFSCSDELLNRLQKNITWGQKGNYLLVPTDCPQRNERMGWTGDAQVFAPTAAYNMDVRDFTKKWLRDLSEATIMYNKNGAVPDTAPLGGDNRPGPCGGWADAAVIVPWELYMEYADKDILKSNYKMMKDWVNYQSSPEFEENGIQITNRRGDHLAYDTSTLPSLCATAYAVRCADLLARSADVLGYFEDAYKYAERFSFLRNAFMDKWMNTDGSLNTSSQTSYALAIDFGILRGTMSDEQINLLKKYNCYEGGEDLKDGTRNGFIKSIADRDYHLSVGFLGISHLLPALTIIGENETTARILMQKTEPGWLYSVINGATTIWERWNSYIAETGTFGDVNMNSFNHYAYGSVGDWMYQNILGIKKISAGYKEILLKPTPISDLKFAKGYHKSVCGTIKAEWKIEDKSFTYMVSVPQNVYAKVILPDNSVYEITSGGEYKYIVNLT